MPSFMATQHTHLAFSSSYNFVMPWFLFLRYLLPRRLVQLVNSTADAPKISKSLPFFWLDLHFRLNCHLNISSATPHTSNIPSKIFLKKTDLRSKCLEMKPHLWLTLITNLPTSTAVRISWTIFTHSASGIIASYSPAMSKSHW